MQPQDQVRIGSITKTFVATVVLQLAAERRLSLNDSVQKWLPGVITGHGYHPARITIRQLLQQTSGIRDYTADPGFQTVAEPGADVAAAAARRHRVGARAAGARLGVLEHQLHPAWHDHPEGDRAEPDHRDQPPDPSAARPARHLIPADQQADPLRRTRTGTSAPSTSPTWSTRPVAWTAGAMISTVDDVARFYRALLTGRLLPPAQQRELLATIPVDDTGELFAEHYGLGIYSVQLSCGTAWGHDGGYPRRLQDLRLHQPRREPAGRHRSTTIPRRASHRRQAPGQPRSSAMKRRRRKSRFAGGDKSNPPIRPARWCSSTPSPRRPRLTGRPPRPSPRLHHRHGAG